MAYRYKLKIAYDGTDYAGWQIQPHKKTIQGALEHTLSDMLAGAPLRLEASGRTDAGVHARAQVAHVDFPEKIGDLRYFCRGVNALLDEDIRVQSIQPVEASFHARFSAQGKEYRYFIYNGMVVPPPLRHIRLQEGRRLDVHRMNAAAVLLQGKHDFAPFAANRGYGDEDTVRTVHQIKVVRRGAEVMISATGEGFLYKMVRSIAGFLMDVGMGRIEPEEAKAIFAKGERTARVQTALAKGLFLWRVMY